MSTARVVGLAIACLPLFGQERSAEAREVPRSLLSAIKVICVERLSGTQPLADAAREMTFAALYAAHRFTVLEKCDKAQATIKGAVLESSERRSRSESEGIGFGAVTGGANSSQAGISGVAGSNGESLSSSETKRQSSVSLRLVDSEGTVLWAVTQDSTGGKSKGAVADAVERAVRQLLRETRPDSADSK